MKTVLLLSPKRAKESGSRLLKSHVLIVHIFNHFRGSFATVKQGRNRATGEKVAIKIVQK